MAMFELDDPYHFWMPIPVPPALATEKRRVVDLEFARDGGELTAQERSMIERFLADIGPVAEAVADGALAGYAKQYAIFGPHVPGMLTSEAMTKEALLQRIDLRSICLHPVEMDAPVSAGFLFGCDWDDEHGFGVLVHGRQVINVGGADTALLG